MIRPAISADAPGIGLIWNKVIRETLITFNPVEKPVEEIESLIAVKADQGFGFFVAAEGSDILGFATYGQFRNGNGYAHTVEHSILLAEAAWGRGIGRALMRAVEDHAAAYGAHSIFAGVSAANPAGRAFHAALGYCEIATLPEVGWKFGQWIDLHLMQKVLRADSGTKTS